MEISFSNLSLAAYQQEEEQTRHLSNSPPQRRTSLVRPERSRVDPQHPQYHTRKRVIDDNPHRSAGDRAHPTRRSVLRRGLLGRDDDDKQSNDHSKIEYTTDPPKNSFDLWKAYCYLVTCCCPPPALRALGKKLKISIFSIAEF